MAHALVTGASGFIGHHLVKLLSERGDEVTCLVRRQSNRSGVEPFNPNYAVGDVTDLESVRRSLHGIDVVYHLAGLTKSLGAEALYHVNEEGSRNIARASAERDRPPVVVVASSLAAAGPSRSGTPRTESETPAPVSHYGKSKRAGELAGQAFSGQVPITVVRPPIVFGEGDKDGFELFRGIARFGVHLVPSFRDHDFSLIHADDLAFALTRAAERGSRMKPDDEEAGVYFAADEQTVSYAEFGRMVGRGLGRPRAVVLRTPGALIWTICSANELLSRVRRRAHILNLDKAREATAGAWACSPSRLRHDTGFRCELSLKERIDQTVDWYVREGWLKRRG